MENKYSFYMEQESNTPDFILAKYLLDCLRNWNRATTERDRWYGVQLRPGNSRFLNEKS